MLCVCSFTNDPYGRGGLTLNIAAIHDNGIFKQTDMLPLQLNFKYNCKFYNDYIHQFVNHSSMHIKPSYNVEWTSVSYALLLYMSFRDPDN